MSISPSDLANYYPSYVNPNPELSAEEFSLIQNSWQQIKDGEFDAFKAQSLIADSLGFWGCEFYETLFELDPTLEPLFKNKLKQSHMLTEMIDAALGLLPGTIDQTVGEIKTEIDPKLVPVLVDLAERHVSYKVEVSHYGTVGLALINNFEKMLGSNFEQATKAAWVELWSLICTVMIPAHLKKAQEINVEVQTFA